MKKLSYLLGIVLFLLFTAGMVVLGSYLPKGEPPDSYLEAQKEEVSVDSFETRGIRKVDGFWVKSMPDANINIIIRTTNDPRKCCATYPKDLIRMVRTDSVLLCYPTEKGRKIDVWRKNRLVHKYSDFDVRVLSEYNLDQDDGDGSLMQNYENNNYDIFIYLTVPTYFWAIRCDSPGCNFLFVDAKLPSLYYTNQENGSFTFLGKTTIDDFCCAWIFDRLDLRKAHIKNMKIQLGYSMNYGDGDCKVGHLLVTDEGNLTPFFPNSYGSIEVREKKYGDITYGTDSIPMATLMKNNKK